MTLAAMAAGANDLKELYELALTRDASLQAAGFQRDATIESGPSARSMVAASLRERIGKLEAGRGSTAASSATPKRLTVR